MVIIIITIMIKNTNEMNLEAANMFFFYFHGVDNNLQSDCLFH